MTEDEFNERATKLAKQLARGIITQAEHDAEYTRIHFEFDPEWYENVWEEGAK